MNINFFERGPAALGKTEDKKSYHRYWELGGNINKKDYESALARAEHATVPDQTQISQAEEIAKSAGIELHNTKDTVDERIILYGILRSDVNQEKVVHHHSQMSDQQIFAEALRMLGDSDSLDKLIDAYPSISFTYREEEKYKKAA